MKKIYYSTSDGKKLCGIIDICNDSEDIVIICHARGSSKDSNATTRIQEELTKNNVNSIRFDFRGHGESEGTDFDELTSNFKIDLEDTITMLNSKGYKNIHLLGTSMGGKIVSLVDFSKFDIKSITLWYPAILNFKNEMDVRLNRMFKSKEEKEALSKGCVIVPSSNGHKVSSEYFEDDRRYIPVQNLKTAKCPVLILHGDKDRFVNYKDSEYVHKVVPNSMLYLIPNGDHSFKDEECMNKALGITTTFINSVMEKENERESTRGRI